jgi:hypothetical protein
LGRLFDLEVLVKNSGLPKARVQALLSEIRKEFPDDELLRELHVVRAIMHEKGLYREQVAAQA